MFRVAIFSILIACVAAAPARRLHHEYSDQHGSYAYGPSKPPSDGSSFLCCVVGANPSGSDPGLYYGTDLVYPCSANSNTEDNVGKLQYRCSSDTDHAICDQWIFFGAPSDDTANGAVHLNYVYEELTRGEGYNGKQPHRNALDISYSSPLFPPAKYITSYQETNVPENANSASAFDYAFYITYSISNGYNPCRA